MKKETFAKDFSLQLKYMDVSALEGFTNDAFFKPFSKQTVLSSTGDLMIPELFEKMKNHSIVHGIFDVELNFGEDREVLARIDDTLLIAYTYTAYTKVFESVIEPYLGEGKVFAVIHGGEDESGIVAKPFMQLIILADDLSVWDPATNEWTTEFTEWLKPLQQGLVDYLYLTYPEYITGTNEWVKLKTFDHQLSTLPLVDESELV